MLGFMTTFDIWSVFQEYKEADPNEKADTECRIVELFENESLQKRKEMMEQGVLIQKQVSNKD